MADDLSSPSHNPNFKLIPHIILHDLSLLCSFIISHPLYSSYFIYFTPYMIKLFSFMSPLFIVTVLLSLLLTTTTAFCPKLPQFELGILQIVVQKLRSNFDHVSGDVEECNFEDFDVYKLLFDRALSIAFCTEEAPIVENSVQRNDDSGMEKLGLEECNSGIEKLGLEMIGENSGQCSRRNDVIIGDKVKEEKGLEKLFEELDRFEEFTSDTSADFDKVVGELQKVETAPVKKVSKGSEVKSVVRNSSDISLFSQNSVKSSSWRSNSSSNFSSHGSMKEEKEWRRTLACKLFEERHNSQGGEEGMDSLWETYENDNSKDRKEIMNNNNKELMMMMKKKNSFNGGIKSSEAEEDDDGDDYDDDDYEDDEDEPEMRVGPLCCLQALKLSTGKMKLGMGKPNIVKITRALKGFGWLHHVKKKHGKKSSCSSMD